ncbi:MAG: zinc-dependent metalloprotease [Gemmataceae bacterium]
MKILLPSSRRAACLAGVCMAFLWLLPTSASAQMRDYNKVIEGYTKVVSTTDGKKPMWEIWVNKKTQQMLAAISKTALKKKYFWAMTTASGEKYAGLQEGDLYIYLKKYDGRLALIIPNVETRSTGDLESRSSVKRLFTDKVLVDVPILAKSPKNEYLIDMDELLVKYAPKFFGVSTGSTAYRLREIVTAKAFPQNVELAYKLPLSGGRLKTLHYSISIIPDSTGYKPRKADDRVGYFTTAYNDLGKYKRNETRTRYINRWNLQKADPKLRLSPPKKPIIFYIEHTTPIRYRRFVRDGILYWNKAFEKIGITNAVEVRFQDKATNAYMDLDPEDVRYNFVRWLNNNISTAIGPSRVHPLTGEILDADIILTDGWIRVFENQFSDLLPKLMMQGYGPETLAWLERHPRWDPRILLAPAHKRNMMLQHRAMRGAQPFGGHPLGNVRSKLLGDDEYDGLVGRHSQVNGMCMAAVGRAFDMSMLRMTLDMLAAQENAKKKDAKAENKEETVEDEKLDGVPAKFIGPLLADLVAHEVGHTLGLRHNFKASSLYTLKEINSNKIKGKKPLAASVMDYLPLNINIKDGEVQGDYAMIGVGPYDIWAIEYGYTLDESQLPKILARCTERANRYLTDQDTVGPDPLARRYDFSAEPIDYAKNQIKLAEYHRGRLLKDYLKKGDSWAKARRGYDMTLSLQIRSLSMMANWIGGAYLSREHKGDKGDREPITPVEAKKQRDALKWVIDHAFVDDVYGLSPKILRRLRSDFLQSDESFSFGSDPTFPIHDRIMGVQSSMLTSLMSPTTLRRVYDNEFMVEADKDALTLPEMLSTLKDSIFEELQKPIKGKFTTRKPMISSLRRNLQREFVERLIDLTHPSSSSASTKPISTLSRLSLRQLSSQLAKTLKQGKGNLDAYTLAHLEDTQERVTKALDAQYTVSLKEGSSSGMLFLFREAPNARYANPECSHCQNRPAAPKEWDARR